MNTKLEKKGGIGVLSITRPEAMNALSKKIVDEIDAAADSILADEDIRVLIIHSEKNFAAGADINDMVDCDPAGAKKFSFAATFNKIERLPIPTIAAMEGYALGGGLELAMVCDIRIADEKAVMGFPEIKLGIMPGAGGTIRAPRLIGAAKAKELIFTGATVKADEAEKLGLVNKVVPEGGALEAAEKLAAKLASCSSSALRIAKQTIYDGLQESSVETGVAIEYENWSSLFTTEDQKEGMKAFLEKRRPNYTGK